MWFNNESMRLPWFFCHLRAICKLHLRTRLFRFYSLALTSRFSFNIHVYFPSLINCRSAIWELGAYAEISCGGGAVSSQPCNVTKKTYSTAGTTPLANVRVLKVHRPSVILFSATRDGFHGIFGERWFLAFRRGTMLLLSIFEDFLGIFIGAHFLWCSNAVTNALFRVLNVLSCSLQSNRYI